MERRALAIDPDPGGRARLAGHGAPVARPRRRGDRGDPARRSGSIPTTARRTRRWRARSGSARGISPRRFRCSSARSCSNPEAGYSYLQLGLLLSWEGSYAEAASVSPPRGRTAGSVHLRQRRAADGRRQRAPRLRLLPAGPLRRRDPRIRARDGVPADQRPRAQGTQRDGARHQARRGLPARRQDGRRRAALRSRAQDLRVAGRQGRRRSVHPLLHRRPARAARRRRQGVRLARTCSRNSRH